MAHARSSGNTLDDVGIVRPVGRRVAVDLGRARPGVTRLQHDPGLGQRQPEEVGERGIPVRVAGHNEVLHGLHCAGPSRAGRCTAASAVIVGADDTLRGSDRHDWWRPAAVGDREGRVVGTQAEAEPALWGRQPVGLRHTGGQRGRQGDRDPTVVVDHEARSLRTRRVAVDRVGHEPAVFVVHRQRPVADVPQRRRLTRLEVQLLERPAGGSHVALAARGTSRRACRPRARSSSIVPPSGPGPAPFAPGTGSVGAVVVVIAAPRMRATPRGSAAWSNAVRRSRHHSTALRSDARGRLGCCSVAALRARRIRRVGDRRP